MYELTEDDKKRLTEFLGECWDADKRPGGDLPNRTFSTAQDMVDLAKKLVDSKWTLAFHEHAVDYWSEKVDVYDRLGWESFTMWLITNPTLFCKLVAEEGGRWWTR